MKGAISLKRFLEKKKTKVLAEVLSTINKRLNKKVIKEKSETLVILQKEKVVSKSQFNFSCQIVQPPKDKAF